jgi:hypothetical protein
VIGSPKTSLRSAPPAAVVEVETGMRRVSWVRILLDERGAHCEVLGVGHRFPSVRRVSLDTALALAARGVPTVVRAADGTTRKLTAAG